MKTDFLIIGGGVAGLAALNRLSDRGANVTLLEEGSYPSHKICGEFLSPEALPILRNWGINPSDSITKARFILGRKTWSMTFPLTASAMPRYILDELLAKRALEKGACIKTEAKVEHIERGESFTVTLASGEKVTAHTLFLSAGRLVGKLTGNGPPPFVYIGVKAHFSGLQVSNELVMHLMPGAYFGMAPIGDNKVNVAGIIACSPEEARFPQKTLMNFLNKPKANSLRDMLSKGEPLFDWFTGPVPEFGERLRPAWDNTYFLGDAAGVIPPATGNGLAMGLSSGILAADHAFDGSLDAYNEEWGRLFGKRIRRGKILHKIFLNSWPAKCIPIISRVIPALPNYFFRSTRGS